MKQPPPSRPATCRRPTPSATSWCWAWAAPASRATSWRPRAAIGALVAPLCTVLYRLGLAPGAHALMTCAQVQLARRRAGCRPEVEGTANPARELARRIGRTIPLFYGGGALGAVAAYRWK